AKHLDRDQNGGRQQDERSWLGEVAVFEPDHGVACPLRGSHRGADGGVPERTGDVDRARAGTDGCDDGAESEGPGGDGDLGGEDVVGGRDVDGGAVDHAPSSRTTCGSTSASARRRSSAKSISVQRSPVTSTQPT